MRQKGKKRSRFVKEKTILKSPDLEKVEKKGLMYIF